MTTNEEYSKKWSNVPVAGAVISLKDKFLLVQERQNKAYGLWNLPAGKLDEGETAEEAATRETLEETGYEVDLGRHLLTVERGNKGALHSFEGEIIGGNLQHQEDELLDARFFTIAEIRKLAVARKLRDPWVLASIEMSLGR